MLAEFELDPNAPQRAEGQDTGHHHGGAGSDAPSDGDKVIASDEGGEISESGKPAPQAEAGGERADSGTVVGAMEFSNAIRSEQASSAGGVKAMPAVRAMARKLDRKSTRLNSSH